MFVFDISRYLQNINIEFRHLEADVYKWRVLKYPLISDLIYHFYQTFSHLSGK